MENYFCYNFLLVRALLFKVDFYVFLAGMAKCRPDADLKNNKERAEGTT